MEVVRQETGKVCLACGSSLPLTAFGKKASAKDGLNPQCIPCNRVYMAQWRIDHPDQVRKNSERWRRKNPAYAQDWQSKNMDSHTAANARYRDRLIRSARPSESSVKDCRGCQQTKPLSEFWVTSTSKDGRAAKCVPCSMELKRMRFYQMTPVKFAEMWKGQSGRCRICTDPMEEYGKGGCVVDHDHSTGKVRALLCSPCNLAIGQLKDSPERADQAAKYLRDFGR